MSWYVFNVLFVCQVVCQDVGGIECVCGRWHKDSRVGVCIWVTICIYIYIHIYILYIYFIYIYIYIYIYMAQRLSGRNT